MSDCLSHIPFYPRNHTIIMKKIQNVFAILLFVVLINFLPQNISKVNSAVLLSSSSDNDVAIAQFENYVMNLYYECNLAMSGLDIELFKYAMTGYYNLIKEGRISFNNKKLSIIDYRKASNEKRLFVIDLNNKRLIYNTYVAHGRRSGLLFARNFSNKEGSNQSSLGFFVTGSTYQGKHGYSLKLQGMEYRFNGNATSRGIVIHGANYVEESFVSKHNAAGFSLGCPSVPYTEHRQIIDDIKYGNVVFAFCDQLDYLNNSHLLNKYNAALCFKQYYY